MTIEQLLAELDTEGDRYPFTLDELRRLDDAGAVDGDRLRRLVAAWAQRHGAWLERHGWVLLAMPDERD